MCGIIAAAGALDLTAAVAALDHRGPDAAATVQEGGVTLGHTRLAIQDPTARADQPYRDGPVCLVYNGELFNQNDITDRVEDAAPGRTWATSGDTEVVAAALNVLGPETALPLLDGMYGLAWTDARRPGILHVARDRHGEVPLHVHQAAPLLVASELKAFRALGRRCGPAVVDVPAGQWWELSTAGSIRRHLHHQLTAAPNPTLTRDTAARELRGALARGVFRRLVADVPVCALLSGGLDSAAIVAELVRHRPGLTCYTARLDPRSRDLRCAREAAETLGVTLVEVDVAPPTADDLTHALAVIEQPRKAQVEITWPCLALAARMHADGFKVTYSGEGSDELWASYGYAYRGLAEAGWYGYRRHLVAAQAVRNFPRVNKAFMAHSVEARLPFLDPELVTLALSMPRHVVRDADTPAGRKAVLSAAYADRLPASITRRPKVGFQDGLGLKPLISRTLPDPARYYRAEHHRLYG
ncbi:asparagine synthetase B family protein [Streptomyces fuscigenes]|uniref:asparagine synthetase B family protein n=1 Tax=Streptomyces fuscigenes TaxID=1528880 RepID=UPI001F320727|nr:asparagine synthetase B [Streptomyces fuscigenes]MCF3960280.1 asparagine synthetase B [Streptomyces fuscigenes]